MSADVFEPHRRALVFGAARVAHGIDVHREGVTEPVLHIARRQIDEKCRQLLVALRGVNGVVYTIIGWERCWLTTTVPVIESTDELGGTAQIDLVS